MALYFSCGKTSGPKATRDYSPSPSALHGSQRTNHIFFETECVCGHCNRVEPHAAMPDVNWPNTALSEWRLVAPRLAAMIVLLSKRHRNSRRLIREFLLVFLGLELSIGTIDQTIREAGRSVAPLEEALIRDIEEAAIA